MKTILVPVDFSEYSYLAAKYALFLAARTKSNVLLIHGLTVPVEFAGTAAITMNELEKSHRTKLESLQDELKETLKQDGVDYVDVDSKTIIGFPADIIIEEAKKISPYLIVMGTKGASGLKKTLIGSIANSVQKKSSFPVLLIPENSQLNPPRNVLYASDFNMTVEPSMIEWLVDLCVNSASKLHIVHVAEQNTLHDELSLEQLRLAGEIRNENISINTAVITHPDIHEGIDKFATENKIDLIVLLKQKRRFLDRLFHESTTSDFAFQSTVPVLILHEQSDV